MLRDIPVYSGWLNQESANLADDVPGFVKALNAIFDGESNKIEAGYRVAQKNSLENIASELVATYQKVMEL